MPTLVEFVTSSAEDAAPDHQDRAFLVWSQTALAQYRLTSAVELYGPNGRLVSPFALNLPDTPHAVPGRQLRRVGPLRRGVAVRIDQTRTCCGRAAASAMRGKPVGGIVVRAMFDYRDLPFISAQRRYLSALGPDRQPPV